MSVALGQVAQVMTVALFLALVANRLVEGLIKPIYAKFGWDSFSLLYVAWLIGGVLAWFAGINLFAPWFPDQLVGKILTAVVTGGGANMINSIFGALDASKVAR